MKKVLFSACIVLFCSAFAWGALNYPTTDTATTDEPTVKIIKIGDKDSAPAKKCGKTCGRRPSDKLSLGGDVFVVTSDPCAGCTKKGTSECSQKCGKDQAARCPVTGASANMKCDSKCDGKCSCKNCKCDGKCSGQCDCTNCKCAAQCGKDKCGKTSCCGDCHHGNKAQSCHCDGQGPCHKGKRGHHGFYGRKAYGCHGQCDGHCKADCRGDCHGDCSCQGQGCGGSNLRGMIVIMINQDGSYTVKTMGDCDMGASRCPVMKGMHRGFGHHGQCHGDCHRGMKTDGCHCRGQGPCHKGKAAKGCHCDGHGDCHRGNKAQSCHCDGQGPCHKDKAAKGCSGQCHGKAAAHCGNAPKAKRSCQDKCDHHKKTGKMKHHGKKAKFKKTLRRGASCGEI